MPLREVLYAPVQYEYDYRLGSQQPAQPQLRAVRAQLQELLPPGYVVRVSGSAQNPPEIPWIAVLDPDETRTAQEGLYLVYLYTRDLLHVYLSMNQGVTAHQRHFREIGARHPNQMARDELGRQAALIRDQLGVLPDAVSADMDLGGMLPLGSQYEAGNIASVRYGTGDLPPEAALASDLTRFLTIYQAAVAGRDHLLLTRPGTLPGASKPAPSTSGIEEFRPKNDSEYLARIGAHTQQRTRRHETLVRDFGNYMRKLSRSPYTSVHPRDLIVRFDGTEYLVEAKVVRANAESAVREAIGQLFSYRHFLYRRKGLGDPVLVALLSESVGGAFVDLLTNLDIGAVWHEHGRWIAAGPALPLMPMYAGAEAR